MSTTRLVLRLAALAALGLTFPPGAARAAAQQQTIVFMRHGEKPAAGLGQLDCQGLNRALALPQVLAARYGTPDAIFAPDPHHTVRDHGRDYNYIRPLATIEPTAIRFGRPVTTTFGFKQVAGLQRELMRARYAGALVFVAWEHAYLVKAVRGLVARAGGNAAAVPDWRGEDFDSLYVLRFTRDGKKRSVTFTRDAQGLDHRAATCP